MSEEDNERARSQAKAQLDDIVIMVERMKHISDCDGVDCELTDEEILSGLGYVGKRKATDDERMEYHGRDAIDEMINNDPVSVQVRSGWQKPGEELEPEEYEILLCTGGPAVRIVGDLDGHDPISSRLEYQDWGTQWTEYFPSSEEREALLAYARHIISI
jgi:hypothetical protein